jgi:hypothetical protein
MPTINEFYEVSKTDESIFDEEQIAIIEQILATVNDTQLLATAQYLIDLFAVKNDSRVLRRHANRLLLELAEREVPNTNACSVNIS